MVESTKIINSDYELNHEFRFYINKKFNESKAKKQSIVYSFLNDDKKNSPTLKCFLENLSWMNNGVLLDNSPECFERKAFVFLNYFINRSQSEKFYDLYYRPDNTTGSFRYFLDIPDLFLFKDFINPFKFINYLFDCGDDISAYFLLDRSYRRIKYLTINVFSKYPQNSFNMLMEYISDYKNDTLPSNVIYNRNITIDTKKLLFYNYYSVTAILKMYDPGLDFPDKEINELFKPTCYDKSDCVHLYYMSKTDGDEDCEVGKKFNLTTDQLKIFIDRMFYMYNSYRNDLSNSNLNSIRFLSKLSSAVKILSDDNRRESTFLIIDYIKSSEKTQIKINEVLEDICEIYNIPRVMHENKNTEIDYVNYIVDNIDMPDFLYHPTAYSTLRTIIFASVSTMRNFMQRINKNFNEYSDDDISVLLCWIQSGNSSAIDHILQLFVTVYDEQSDSYFSAEFVSRMINYLILTTAQFSKKNDVNSDSVVNEHTDSDYLFYPFANMYIDYDEMYDKTVSFIRKLVIQACQLTKTNKFFRQNIESTLQLIPAYTCSLNNDYMYLRAVFCIEFLKEISKSDQLTEKWVKKYTDCLLRIIDVRSIENVDEFSPLIQSAILYKIL